MKLEAKISEAGIVKSLLHDIERGHLLSDEKDSSPRSHRGRDEVRDGLTLARSWWPLDDHALTSQDLRDGCSLAGITVGDNVLSEFMIRNRRAGGSSTQPSAQDLCNDRLAAQPPDGTPSTWLCALWAQIKASKQFFAFCRVAES